MRRRAAVGLALFALLPLGGCGTGGLAEGASTGNGGELFIEKCGGCHVLADAGTRGTIGPNLDDAFAVPIEEGFDESSVREVVLGQMRYPVAPMPPPEELFPPGEYTEEERQEAMKSIAAYVASVAGRPPSGGGAAAPGGGTTTGEGTTTRTGGTTTARTGTTARTDTSAAGADGRALFAGNCASCHTFAAAGSSGTIGPNLDQSGLDRAAIERQIRRGGGGMPPFEGTLSDQEIEALARYVDENRRR